MEVITSDLRFEKLYESKVRRYVVDPTPRMVVVVAPLNADGGLVYS